MAALVDYSSDSESDPTNSPPPKKAKISSTLPALPSAFHDLYASNVRTAPADNPLLHQGRTRQTPHVAGNWPSHIYIEWIPTSAEHNLLSSLLDALDEPQPIPPSSPSPQSTHSLLTSDLGTPLPLHISLSRPFVLTSANREAFLEDVRRSLAGAVKAFTARAYDLAWHQSPESDRAFLVLRVRVESPGDQEQQQEGSGREPLMELLRRCNTLVRDVGQPELYAGVGHDAASAFHVSIAWAPGLAGDAGQREEGRELRARKTRRVWDELGFGEKIAGVGIEVDSVKCKIGNVVTSLPLAGGTGERRAGAGLFGE